VILDKLDLLLMKAWVECLVEATLTALLILCVLGQIGIALDED
jgi:hypothetical protein